MRLKVTGYTFGSGITLDEGEPSGSTRNHLAQWGSGFIIQEDGASYELPRRQACAQADAILTTDQL
jgi:hypothetical protein